MLSASSFGIKIKPRDSSSSVNINALWQWGLVSQICTQFAEMHLILNYEVPRPGLNIFQPAEVTKRVLHSGIRGFGVGFLFSLTSQLTKVWRGKNDPWNSFVGGAAIGALLAAQKPKPFHSGLLVGYYGIPCAVIHYFYDKSYEGMLAAETLE